MTKHLRLHRHFRSKRVQAGLIVPGVYEADDKALLDTEGNSLAEYLVASDHAYWLDNGGERVDNDDAPAPASDSLELEAIDGIGESTAKALAALGIRTFADLAALTEAEADEVAGVLGRVSGERVLEWAAQADALATQGLPE